MSYSEDRLARLEAAYRALDVEHAAPADIDAVLFESASQLQHVEGQLAGYKQRLEEASVKALEAKAKYGGSGVAYYEQQGYENYERESRAERERLPVIVNGLNAEFERRGGWSRYLICHSDNGHYHKHGCHTLWRGARPSSVSWVANLSGLDDNGVVEAVGFKACSQPECFPEAPLSPAWARSEKEAKADRDARRDAKYAKGLAMREKKVANIEKRLAKARVRLGSADEYERSNAQYDIRDGERDLVWAKREVERWLAKRS